MRLAVIKAAAEKVNWDVRPSPRRGQNDNKVSAQQHRLSAALGQRVATIAEVEIERSTGKVWVRKITVGHDCGEININPSRPPAFSPDRVKAAMS